MSPIQSKVERDGLAILPQLFSLEELNELREHLGPAESAGERGLLSNPGISALAKSEKLMELVRPHLCGEPLAVRGVYFEKSASINWIVPWHQDLTIAVRERAEIEGFGPWSEKSRIPHVQPPAELLEKMITVRIHLDETDQTNGALRVLPRTHLSGRLSADRIQALRSEIKESVCKAAAGDTLLMRPLLLHASSRSTSNRRRRVLHIEYAGFALPSPLQWNESA